MVPPARGRAILYGMHDRALKELGLTRSESTLPWLIPPASAFAPIANLRRSEDDGGINLATSHCEAVAVTPS
jgi:hypothetical protein